MSSVLKMYHHALCNGTIWQSEDEATTHAKHHWILKKCIFYVGHSLQCTSVLWEKIVRCTKCPWFCSDTRITDGVSTFARTVIECLIARLSTIERILLIYPAAFYRTLTRWVMSSPVLTSSVLYALRHHSGNTIQVDDHLVDLDVPPSHSRCDMSFLRRKSVLECGASSIGLRPDLCFVRFRDDTSALYPSTSFSSQVWVIKLLGLRTSPTQWFSIDRELFRRRMGSLCWM